MVKIIIFGALGIFSAMFSIMPKFIDRLDRTKEQDILVNFAVQFPQNSAC